MRRMNPTIPVIDCGNKVIETNIDTNGRWTSSNEITIDAPDKIFVNYAKNAPMYMTEGVLPYMPNKALLKNLTVTVEGVEYYITDQEVVLQQMPVDSGYSEVTFNFRLTDFNYDYDLVFGCTLSFDNGIYINTNYINQLNSFTTENKVNSIFDDRIYNYLPNEHNVVYDAQFVGDAPLVANNIQPGRYAMVLTDTVNNCEYTTYTFTIKAEDKLYNSPSWFDFDADAPFNILLHYRSSIKTLDFEVYVPNGTVIHSHYHVDLHKLSL